MSDFSAIPWTVACQCLLSMGFSRQEYWNGLPFPSPGQLPKPGIEPLSLMSPELEAGPLLLTSHFMGNRWGNSGNSVRLYFEGLQNQMQMVTTAMKLKDAYSLEGKL